MGFKLRTIYCMAVSSAVTAKEFEFIVLLVLFPVPEIKGWCPSNIAHNFRSALWLL